MPVQVGVGGPLDVQVATADVVDCLVVHHEGTVGVLQGGVGGQDGVVRLDNSSGNLGRGVDGKLQLRLLAIVNRETFHEEGGETGSGAAAKGVEDEETLEAGALVGQLPNPVQHQVDDLLADGVVAPGVVVGGVLLAGNQLLGVEELAVRSSSHFIDHGGLKVDKDGPGDVLAGSCLREEGVEGVVASSDGLVGRHLAIGLDSVLKAIELPAGVSHLGAGLANVDGDAQSMQSIMQPSRSPQSIPLTDRPLFPPNQYRMSSPQYQNQGHPNYNNSPTYPGTPNSQGYPRPPTPSYPKPPTPGGGYPQPPTPQNYGKPPTPQNSSIQNPLTPGSYQNPTTPVSYQNPTTPVSNQNPLTPSSHQNPLTPQPQDQTVPPVPNAASQPPNCTGQEKSSQPVIQQNPMNVNNSFSQPKSDSVIQSASVPNIFKDGSKITTPMLSPPSSTNSASSLRKFRRPSKSVTPGTVSPNQKNLSPNQSKECIKSEPDPLIEPKKEPECDSPPEIPAENERIQEPTSIKSE